MKPERRDSGGDRSRPGDRRSVEGAAAGESQRRALWEEPSPPGHSIAQVASVVACVVAITLYVQLGDGRKAKPLAPAAPEAVASVPSPPKDEERA